MVSAKGNANVRCFFVIVIIFVRIHYLPTLIWLCLVIILLVLCVPCSMKEFCYQERRRNEEVSVAVGTSQFINLVFFVALLIKMFGHKIF